MAEDKVDRYIEIQTFLPNTFFFFNNTKLCVGVLEYNPIIHILRKIYTLCNVIIIIISGLIGMYIFFYRYSIDGIAPF